MVLIIAGSRTITDIETLRAAVATHGLKDQIDLVISGGAQGVDSLAKIFARENWFPFREIIADWNNLHAKGAVVKYNGRGAYNAAAGIQRNEVMAQEAVKEATSRNTTAALLLVWDGASKGSKHMRHIAQQYELTRYEYIVSPAIRPTPQGRNRR